MDYQKKKVLTQSVAYIQAHLTLTSDLLTSLKLGAVLTDEEVSTIQKDETTSGKVLELLCLLKRKDNRTYTRFIQVLQDRQCNNVVQLLQNKGVQPEGGADIRTSHYLENYLGNTSINQRTMNDMSNNLVLREIHHDEVTQLQDKISALQRQIKAKNNLRSDSTQSMGNSDTGSDRSTPTTLPDNSRPALSPTDNVAGMFTQQDVIIRQKDDIIRRREEEYMKLRTILTKTQTEMQSVLDLNNQYLNIIGQMNQMQLSSAVTPRFQDKDTAMLDLERRLEETEEQMAELEQEMFSVNNDLKHKTAELEKAKRKEKRYKDMLGLPEEATEDDIEEKIKQIVDEGSMRKQEVERIQRELTKAMGNRGSLEEKLTSLGREKEKISFHMRQQELTIKKMNRMKAASGVIQSAENMITQATERSQVMKLPNIDRAGSQIGLASNRCTTQQYCMFCRMEYQPLKAQNCRLHFRPIRNGKWTCCKDDCHRGAGCLQVPHFYIEITVDKKVFLTDGSRYMELT